MTKKQITKNQHYVPRLLLRNFANEKEKLFECLLSKGVVFPSTVKNTMTSNYTYEHEYFNANSIEDFFATIETKIGSYIKSIESTINDYQNNKISMQQVKNIIFNNLRYYILLYYRSGALLYEFGFDRRDKILLMLEKLANESYVNNLVKTIITYYDFAIVCNKDNGFILSDQCISTVSLNVKNRFWGGTNRHIGFKDIMILMPVSKNYYLAFLNGKSPSYILPNKVNCLSSGELSKINSVIINNSYLKAVCYDRDVLEKAVNTYKYSSPTVILSDRLYSKHKKELFYYDEDIRAWEIICNKAPFEYVYKKEIGRNEKCSCGSGKKYKYCCSTAMSIAKKIMLPYKLQQKFPFESYKNPIYRISPHACIELPIEEITHSQKKS